jgi:DNA topoisomerase I
MARKPKPFEYSTDAEPGITRIARGDGFTYFRPDGRALRRASDLSRIASLAVPPAWTDVWICANPRGHLQATGKDVKGRKQYRYHPAWITERDSNKYASLADFAKSLPRIRRAVVRDLRRPALCKERVLAAVVRLMDQAFIRVGGERYRRENGSFGATTLRNRHVRKTGDAIVLDFRGKSGKRHTIRIDDDRVVRVIRRCLDLPGDVLFQYKDGNAARSISASDVNAYLRDIAGADVTSKDFRTWGGTVRAANYLWSAERGEGKKATRGLVREAVKSASQALGNTPAVCRKSYIHPRIFECYEKGVVVEAPPPMRGLRADERMALALLKARMPTVSELLRRSLSQGEERRQPIAA